jgi:hypothetical protein
VTKWKKNDMSISKYKMPILCFVSIPPNILDKILEVFSNLERSLKFKNAPKGRRCVHVQR